MTWILIIWTALPAWFVGPLPTMQLSPGAPPVYYSGPSIALPLQPTPDGRDRLVVIVDPPAPPANPGPIALPGAQSQPQSRPRPHTHVEP